MAYGDIVEYGGERYRDITPNMTSLTTPAPYKVGYRISKPAQDSGLAWRVFDGTNSTSICFSAYSEVGWQSISFDFGRDVVVNLITVSCNCNSDDQLSLGASNSEGVAVTLASGKYTATAGVFTFAVNAQNIPYQTYSFAAYNYSTGSRNRCFREMRMLQKLPNNYYLLRDQIGLKTIKGGVLHLLESNDINNTLLVQEGFKSLTNIIAVQEQLPDKFDVMALMDDGQRNDIAVMYLPAPQMITPTTDINVSAYSSIKQITLATTGTTGDAKVIFSFDDGITWQTHANGAWAVIEPTAHAVAASGISPADVATIPSEAWSVVTGKLRVACYLSKAAITDDLTIDTLTITGDTASWKKAQRSVDYRVILPNTSTMAVQLLSDGSYKINYMESK